MDIGSSRTPRRSSPTYGVSPCRVHRSDSGNSADSWTVRSCRPLRRGQSHPPRRLRWTRAGPGLLFNRPTTDQDSRYVVGRYGQTGDVQMYGSRVGLDIDPMRCGARRDQPGLSPTRRAQKVLHEISWGALPAPGPILVGLCRANGCAVPTLCARAGGELSGAGDREEQGRQPDSGGQRRRDAGRHEHDALTDP